MRFLSVQQVAARYSVSVASIWRWVALGKFPHPCKQTSGTSRWAIANLEAYERDLERSRYPVWQDASQVRAIVRRAFKVAGLPSYTPHVFRHMFARKVLASDPPVGTFVAFSQNLGHEKPDVTLGSYARPDDQTRARLIAKLDGKPARDGAFELHAMVRELNRLDLDQVIKIFSDYMKSQK